MTDNNDLKSIWGSQPAVSAPDVSDILGKASALKNKTRNKLIRSNVILLLTAIFIGWVWVHYQPQMLTTKIGIVMVIAAIAMYVVATASALPLLFQSDMGSDSAKYLEQMISLRHKQEFVQKTMIVLYFILLSVGLVLYMIEYTMKMSTAGAVAAYGITGAWIAFNWFYTRPRTARKQLSSLNDIIGQLEAINKQLKD